MNPEVILAVVENIGKFQEALGKVSDTVKGVMDGVAEAASAGVTALQGAVSAFADGLNAPVQALQGLVGAVAPFVEALSPSTMAAFSQAVKDAQATIGVAFLGVVNVATSLVQEIAGALLPVVQQLEPIFTKLTNAVGTELVSAVRLLLVPLELLTPLLDLVVGFFNEYAKVVADVIAVVTAFAKVVKDTLLSVFGTDTKELTGVFKGLMDVVRQVIKALVTFGATLAVAIGGADYVGKFADALGKEGKDRDERPGGLKAAASNPSVVDVAGIARAAQLAAFTATAGGGAREKTDTEWLKELSGDLKKIAADRRDLGAMLKSWWDDQVVGGAGILGKAARAADAFFRWVETI